MKTTSGTVSALLAALLLTLGASASLAQSYPDRWVWVFGWGLDNDQDAQQIEAVLDTAGKHGINGAVLSCGLQHLEGRKPEFLQRLERIRAKSAALGIELIPAAYSIGYGGGFLSHNKHLAEGLRVDGSLYVAKAGEARFVPELPASLVNGGFEQHKGDKFTGFRFHDEPGKISFADAQVFHGGATSIRFENLASDEHGHGRVMQTIAVKPHRAYRFSVWVKTENLQPASAFRVQALAGNRSLAPREFDLKPTGDWRRLTMLLNSFTNESINLYAGTWGGREGKFWLDDWTLEEAGPINVLRRTGTPVRVVSESGNQVYEEGRDYARFEDASFRLWRDEDRPAVTMKLPLGSRIKDGERLRVTWYHPMLINDSQVTACMAEPEIYAILDRETKLLGEKLHPKRVLVGMDEVRMGGTCEACRGQDMAKLLGTCMTKTSEALKRNIPGVDVLVWSDMFDPHHNAHGDYYLVDGDFTGTWKHIPKDLGIVVWGGGLRAKSLDFFDEQGFRTWVACYYDADNLTDVKAWLEAAKSHKNIRGFMYTPWTKKYDLLGDFGDLLVQ